MDKKKRIRKWVIRAVLIAAVLLMAVGYLPFGKTFWRGAFGAFGLSHFTDGLSEDAVHIHVISVGKADAILIESPEADLLIDTGTEDAAETVLRYLRARSVDALDAVWISHPDSDHIGGLAAVLGSVPVDRVFFSPTAEVPERFRDLPDLYFPTAGEHFAYGSFSLDVLGPVAVYPDPNDNSLVLRLMCGKHSVLFCGDMEEKAEQDLLESGSVLSADVLKVAHHGSDTSTSEAFLRAVSPTWAVISSGEDGNLLPRNTVLKRLHDAGTAVYRTDLDGSVVFSIENDTIKILTENGGLQT